MKELYWIVFRQTRRFIFKMGNEYECKYCGSKGMNKCNCAKAKEEILQDFKIIKDCDRCGNEDTIDIYTGFCPSCINKAD